MISPPFRTFAITAGPPDPAKSAAPDNIALNSADEAPMKTGSNSIPCFSKMRASFATNQGRQLRPIGENGKETFFIPCAHTGKGVRKNVIRKTKTQEGRNP